MRGAPARARARLGAALVMLVGVALAALGQAGCQREVSYSQETPDDVVRSLVAMVKSGQASRIDDLIYAESNKMRAVLHHLGELLDQLQKLGVAVHQRFPEDVAKLRAEAETAAKTGEVRGFSLTIGSRGGGARANGGDREEVFKNMAATILADPYGWIDRNAERLGTMQLADDLATVTLDGQPVFPPLGIPLRMEGGKWYIALPLNLPGVASAVPRTDAEWTIIGSMVMVLRNAVKELTDEVEQGGVSGINQLADRAGEKVIWPGLLTWGAYQRELDVRRRRERLTRQFDKRQREWVKAAEESAWGTPRLLTGPIGTLMPAELDRLSRKDNRPNIERMTDAEFAAFLEGVLKSGGLEVSLSREVSVQDVGAAVSKWEAGRGG